MSLHFYKNQAIISNKYTLYIHKGILMMIQFGNIQAYIPQNALFTMPQVPYVAPVSIFQYNPFANFVSGIYNLPVINPTPQGISSYTNPFSSLFNFTIPTFNCTNIWNNFTTKVSQLYNSAKQTASNTWAKVSNFGSKIVSGAKKYLGYNEKDGSYKKFTGGRTEAWCADFATYVARESGAKIPHFSGVSQILSWGNKNGKFSKTAKVGDLIIFKGVDKKGRRVSHTGIVKEIKNGRVYTIEGNTSNQVANVSYSLNDSRITGYVTVA